MCGINGFISEKFNKSDLINMTNALEHRGPDAFGILFEKEKNIGLGHRRLSILDLSNAANQPMISHCGRYHIVFNGEVYNYKEIKSELPKKKWNTNSDTEVVLESFVHWGVNFIEKLNGMFAIAIFDALEEKLYLFRDRMGIKPLYYYNYENDFAFASETKSILKLPIKKIINKQALSEFFHLEYIPNGLSIFENINKLKKGHYLIYKKNTGLKIIKYYNLIEKINTKKSKPEEFQERLKKAVKYRQISDVPIGAFLSGGNDSSMICALFQENNLDPINTFTIGFEEKTHDESIYARQVSEILKTNHYQRKVYNSLDLENMISKVERYDEPFAAPSIVPTFDVSFFTRQKSKVAMSGDGGDELFMGYGYYSWYDRLKRINKLSGSIGFFLLNQLLKQGNNRKKRVSRMFNSTNNIDNWTNAWSEEQYMFSRNEISKLVNDTKFINSTLKNEWEKINSMKIHHYEKVSLFDLEHYLPDNLLYKVDIASMSNSLEVRVPFLDHEFVEYALNLDVYEKIKGKQQKYILKKNLEKHLPDDLIYRKKWGFPSPIKSWLLGDLKLLTEKYLSKEVILNQNLFNYEFIKLLLENFYNSGHHFHFKRIWALLVFQIWYNKYYEDIFIS